MWQISPTVGCASHRRSTHEKAPEGVGPVTGQTHTGTASSADTSRRPVANATWFLPIAKASIFGAVQGGVEVVGSAFLPGIWPIVSKALDPVTDRIKEKLGLDPAASKENAEKAVALLEKDKDLQALVEQSLSEIVGPLRDGQAVLTEGQKQILLILERNDQALRELAKGLGLTVDVLSRGVVISREGEDRFAALLAARVLAEIDQRDAVHAAQRQERNRRFKEHVSRTQARAVELLTERKFDRVTDELRAGLELLEALIQEDPNDTHLTVQLGYFFKTIAQDFLRQNQPSRGEEYNDRALEIFSHVVYQMSHNAKSVRDYTDALNGLGNIHYSRRHFDAAIKYYRLATTIDPIYCYSWHDLFGALYECARAGDEPDIAGMRQALDMTRRTGSGQPGLSDQYLDSLEQRLDALDDWAAARRKRGQKVSALPPANVNAGGGAAPSLTAAREAVANYPDNVDAHLYAGRVFLEHHRPEEALPVYDAALRLKPECFEASAMRGAVLAGMHRLPEAIEELNRALQLRPADPVALYNRACAFSLNDDSEAALEDLKGAIRAFSSYRETAQSDPHLDKLRDNPATRQRYLALVGGS